jgi:hypothetical protein
MAENCRADRARKEAHRIDRECLEHADQRLGRGKEQLAENQSSNDAVQQKIVPFDGGADRAGNNGPAQLDSMVGLGQWARQSIGHRHGKPPFAPLRALLPTKGCGQSGNVSKTVN